MSAILSLLHLGYLSPIVVGVTLIVTRARDIKINNKNIYFVLLFMGWLFSVYTMSLYSEEGTEESGKKVLLTYYLSLIFGCMLMSLSMIKQA